VPGIDLSRKNGRNTRLAHPSLRVATRNESTPLKVLPINPKEKAQTNETIAKYIMVGAVLFMLLLDTLFWLYHR
jgi:hypothetical protein